MKINKKQKLYSKIVDFLKQRGATKVAVFGSYVRDDEMLKNDIDIIVDFDRPIGLLEFVGIERKSVV